jgi:hypothetical protein
MLEMGVLPALLSCWSPGVRRVRTCDDDDGDSCHTHLSRTRGEDKSSTACDDDGADDSCAAPREDDDDEDSAAAVWQLERAALITMHDILASAPSASRAPDTQSKLVEVLRQLVLTATVTDVQFWTLAVLQTLRGEWGVLSQLQTPDIAAALAAWAGAHAGSPLLHRAALESLVTLCEGGTSGIAAVAVSASASATWATETITVPWVGQSGPVLERWVAQSTTVCSCRLWQLSIQTTPTSFTGPCACCTPL